MTNASAPFAGLYRPTQRQVFVALAGLVLLLAAAVRCYRLGTQSFWLDEAYTFERAAPSPAGTIAAIVKDVHVPTYFLFMHYWMALGDSEAMLRTPSVIFGVLSVGATIVLGLIAASGRAALLAGLLVALSPLQVRYGQEARMYTMFTFSAAVAMCGLLWLLKHPEAAARPLWRSVPARESGAWAAWLAYVLGVIGTLYLHNTGVFLLATCGVCALLMVLWHKPNRAPLLANWVLVHLLVLAVWSFWVTYLLRQTEEVMRDFWPDFPTLARALVSLSHLYLFDRTSAPWLSVLLLVLFGMGVAALRKQPLLQTGLLVLSLLVPVLVLLVSLRAPMFLPRIMLWAPIPFYVVTGVGAFAMRGRVLPALVVLLALGGGLITLHAYYYERGVKPPWREVARMLSAQYDNDSLVFATTDQERTSINYYFNRRYKPVPSVPIFTVQPSNLKDHLHGAKTVWLLDRRAGQRSVAKELRAEMDLRARLAWEAQYVRLLVLKYVIDEQKQPLPKPPPSPSERDLGSEDDGAVGASVDVEG